jgi:hypothetical protein
MTFEDSDSVSDFFEFFAINCAYLIPYLMGIFIIYNFILKDNSLFRKSQ